MSCPPADREAFLAGACAGDEDLLRNIRVLIEAHEAAGDFMPEIVALNFIKLGKDTKEVIARFEQERQALATMDHPNIAKVFDGGATPTGRLFFVMELVLGISAPTAKRDWSYARAWLFPAIRSDGILP
jgi:serine/threonine protein kinase